MADPTAFRPSTELDQCVRDCLTCKTTCIGTALYGLSVGGEHAGVGVHRSLTDCERLAGLTANFLIRGSDFGPGLLAMCIEACRRCADLCARFPDDLRMQATADACHRCADSCRRLQGGARPPGVSAGAPAGA